MLLEAIYENKEDIPAAYVALYAERDGKWEISQVNGIKTQTDVDKLSGAAQAERKDHATTKGKLAEWARLGKTTEEVADLLDRLPELEASAESSGTSEEKIQKLVEARIGKATSPLERKIKELEDGNKVLVDVNQGLTSKELTRTIHDNVRTAMAKATVVATAAPDVLMVAERMLEVNDDGSVTTKDGVGVTPGMDATVWLSEMVKTRPHWMPPSSGSGAGGGGAGAGFNGKNPFTHEQWNMGEQGKVLRENPTMAKRLMSDAGVTGPGHRPPPKAN